MSTPRRVLLVGFVFLAAELPEALFLTPPLLWAALAVSCGIYIACITYAVRVANRELDGG